MAQAFVAAGRTLVTDIAPSALSVHFIAGCVAADIKFQRTALSRSLKKLRFGARPAERATVAVRAGAKLSTVGSRIRFLGAQRTAKQLCAFTQSQQPVLGAAQLFGRTTGRGVGQCHTHLVWIDAHRRVLRWRRERPPPNGCGYRPLTAGGIVQVACGTSYSTPDDVSVSMPQATAIWLPRPSKWLTMTLRLLLPADSSQAAESVGTRLPTSAKRTENS